MSAKNFNGEDSVVSAVNLHGEEVAFLLVRITREASVARYVLQRTFEVGSVDEDSVLKIADFFPEESRLSAFGINTETY